MKKEAPFTLLYYSLVKSTLVLSFGEKKTLTPIQFNPIIERLPQLWIQFFRYFVFLFLSSIHVVTHECHHPLHQGLSPFLSTAQQRLTIQLDCIKGLKFQIKNQSDK